jgi:hypothetical protein
MVTRTLRTVLLVLSLAIPGLAADISGTWSGTLSMGDDQITLTYNFKQDGDKVTGYVNTPGGDLQLNDGKVEGDKLSFSVTFEMNGNKSKFLATGDIKGEEITLTTKVENGPDYPAPPLKLKKLK